jgi:hypothetical protein
VVSRAACGAALVALLVWGGLRRARRGAGIGRLGDDQAGEVFITEVARADYEYVGRLARSSEHGRLIGP